MTADLERRAHLTELIIASGLVTIGFVAVQGPLAPLVALAAGVGSNWATSLAERGFQHWRNNWFTFYMGKNGKVSSGRFWYPGWILQRLLKTLQLLY